MKTETEKHNCNCSSNWKTRKPCCSRETARCRCKFWLMPSLLALCWTNICRDS